jgi:hypothetical protein
MSCVRVAGGLECVRAGGAVLQVVAECEWHTCTQVVGLGRRRMRAVLRVGCDIIVAVTLLVPVKLARPSKTSMVGSTCSLATSPAGVLTSATHSQRRSGRQIAAAAGATSRANHGAGSRTPPAARDIALLRYWPCPHSQAACSQPAAAARLSCCRSSWRRRYSSCPRTCCRHAAPATRACAHRLCAARWVLCARTPWHGRAAQLALARLPAAAHSLPLCVPA